MSQSDNNSPKCPYHTAPSPAEGAQQQRELSTTPKQKHGDEPVTPMTTAFGAPVVDNQNSKTAGPRGPLLMEDVWLLEKLANLNREIIPERRMHAKGSGAFGTFTVTHDISKYTRAKLFEKVGKQTEMFARFTTVAGERGAADAERDIRGFALKFYTEEGNWDIVGNNTPVFFFRDPLPSPTSTTRSSAIRAPASAAPTTIGTSGRCCPRLYTKSRSRCRNAASRRASAI